MVIPAVLLVFVQASADILGRGDICPLQNNYTGICKYLEECASAQYGLQVLREKPGLCSFNYSTPIVCCDTKKWTTPIVEVQTKPTISTTTKKQGEEATNTSIEIENRSSVSQEKCELYGNYVYRNQSSPTLLPGIFYEIINSCNVKTTFERGQVISGEYPHLVSIGYTSVKNPIYRCTGALISEEYVLTTATCTSANFGVPQVVRLGTTIKQDYYFEYPEVQHIEVREFIKHPKYNALTKKNDIALIKLVYAATINALTRPACLPQEGKIDATIAVGYGSLSNDGQFQRDIREDVVRLNKGCLRSVPSRIGRSEWCGQFDSSNCVLDEGSPLQIINSSPYCTYTIVGLLSSWERCDSSKTVSVTEVSKYVRWIERNVWN